VSLNRNIPNSVPVHEFTTRKYTFLDIHRWKDPRHDTWMHKNTSHHCANNKKLLPPCWGVPRLVHRQFMVVHQHFDLFNSTDYSRVEQFLWLIFVCDKGCVCWCWLSDTERRGFIRPAGSIFVSQLSSRSCWRELFSFSYQKWEVGLFIYTYIYCSEYSGSKHVEILLHQQKRLWACVLRWSVHSPCPCAAHSCQPGSARNRPKLLLLYLAGFLFFNILREDQ